MNQTTQTPKKVSPLDVKLGELVALVDKHWVGYLDAERIKKTLFWLFKHCPLNEVIEQVQTKFKRMPDEVIKKILTEIGGFRCEQKKTEEKKAAMQAAKKQENFEKKMLSKATDEEFAEYIKTLSPEKATELRHKRGRVKCTRDARAEKEKRFKRVMEARDVLFERYPALKISDTMNLIELQVHKKVISDYENGDPILAKIESRRLVRLGLAFIFSSKEYLQAVKECRPRIDLDGNIVQETPIQSETRVAFAEKVLVELDKKAEVKARKEKAKLARASKANKNRNFNKPNQPKNHFVKKETDKIDGAGKEGKGQYQVNKSTDKAKANKVSDVKIIYRNKKS